MCVKIFNLKCVYIGQPVSEIFEFLTAYIHKWTVKTIDSYNVSYYVESKLGPIMARCGPQMNLTPEK